MTILNFFLGIAETIVVWGCTFYFMKVNGQTLYRKKAWYILGFVCAVLLLYASYLVLINSWLGVTIQLAGTVVCSLLLFHRQAVLVILDLLFAVLLFLGMECGIFIFNITAAMFPQKDYLLIANVAIILKIVFMLLITWAVVRWRKRERNMNLTLGQTVSMLVLPVFSILFVSSLLEISSVYIRLYGIWLVLVDCGGIFLLNMYFLYLLHYLFRTKSLEQEMELAQVQSEVQYRYYESLEQKYRESRKVLHDMKNHLQSLEQLYKEGNREAGDSYVKDLYHMINTLGEKYYSSNHMLNIVLNEKFSRAAALGIQVRAEVGEVSFEDIRDMDITTIFANLLDNSIEAAQKCGEDALIELKVDMVQEFRVIQVRNSCIKEETAERGAGHRGGAHMGLGLENVRHALEQYHGSMEQSRTDREFCVSAMIPGKEEDV